MPPPDIQPEYANPRNQSLPGWNNLVARRLMGKAAISVRGHHYLKGGKGARPRGNDGAPPRRGNITLLKNTSLSDLAFFAAGSPLEVAPANPEHLDPPPAKVPITYICGGCYSTQGYADIGSGESLRKYLSEQDLNHPGKCYSKAGLTPRRVVEGLGKNGTLVWGESCDGWRHFDCLGLVDFSIWKVGKKEDKEMRSVAQWASPQNTVRAQRMSAADPMLDGDLVSQVKDGNFHHIGIIYLKDGVPFVAQAEQTSVGVTIKTPYESSGWGGGRWRLPDDMFLDDDAARGVDLPDTEWRPIGGIQFKIVA